MLAKTTEEEKRVRERVESNSVFAPCKIDLCSFQGSEVLGDKAGKSQGTTKIELLELMNLLGIAKDCIAASEGRDTNYNLCLPGARI